MILISICCLDSSSEDIRSAITPRSILTRSSRTKCLKIDATQMIMILLLRQAQWRSFATRAVKNTTFEFETSNQSFLIIILWASRTWNLFLSFLVINHYHINKLHQFWDSFEWFCFQISRETNIFPFLSKVLRLRINSC